MLPTNTRKGFTIYRRSKSNLGGDLAQCVFSYSANFKAKDIEFMIFHCGPKSKKLLTEVAGEGGTD